MDDRKWKRESWGTKSNQWCHPKPAKIPAEQSETVLGFQASIAGILIGFRRRGWQGNDGRLPSLILVPSSAENRGQKRKLWPGQFCGSGFLGQLIASVSLTRVCICSLFLAYSILLFLLLLNRLIFIHLHICYMAPQFYHPY